MLVQNRDIKSASNMQSERIQMRVDETALAHIMDVLTNLYSDKPLAIVREYSTNAADSHAAAGNTSPIEVTYPTAADPQFIVQDYGVGLSYTDLRDIYSMYGASTKRGTNEQVGMLGMGGKSALAYTNQFTLRCVQNGELVQAGVSRTTDGAAALEIISQTPTNEPNGVRVTVPVADVGSFRITAARFFEHWPTDKVQVFEGQHDGIVGERVTDDFYISEQQQDYIVQGGVPYPCDFGTGWNHSFRLHVPIGTVDFTPSREALQHTARTDAALDQAKSYVHETVRRVAVERFDAATTATEAQAAYNVWGSWLDIGVTRWKGVRYQHYLQVPDGGWRLRYGSATRTSNIKMYDLADVVFVVGFELKSFSASHRERWKLYAEANNLTQETALFCSVLPSNPWVEDVTVVQFDDVRSVKLPKTSVARRGGGGGYDAVIDGCWEQVDAPPDDDLVVYYSRTEYGLARAVVDVLPDVVRIVTGKNRHDKLQRDYPQCRHAMEVLREYKQQAVDNLTEVDKLVLSGELHRVTAFRCLDPAKVADPVLADLLLLSRNNPSAALRTYRSASKVLDFGPTIQYDVSVLDEYPLLDASAARQHADHVYEYIRLMYEGKQNDKV